MLASAALLNEGEIAKTKLLTGKLRSSNFLHFFKFKSVKTLSARLFVYSNGAKKTLFNLVSTYNLFVY